MRLKRGLIPIALVIAFIAGAACVSAQEVTPRQACANLGGMWLDNAPSGYNCCGANKQQGQDFMMVVSNGALGTAQCIHTAKGWQWVARGLAGIIYRIDYEGVYKGGEAVFTDKGPRVCGQLMAGRIGTSQPLGHEVLHTTLFQNDPFLEPRTISNGYECVRTATGAYAIVECKGTHSANSEQGTNPVRVNDPGMNATATDGTRLWCNSDGLWVPTLDSDQNACTLAGQMRIDPATKTIPIVWTGTRCCGDTPGESYVDPLGDPVRDAKGNYMPPFPVGGCWQGKPVRGTGKDRRFVDDVVKDDPLFEQNGGALVNHSIINMNGTFHACQAPAVEFPQYTPVTVIQPPATTGPPSVPVGPPQPTERVWKTVCASCDVHLESLSYANYNRQVGFYYCDAGVAKQLFTLDDCAEGGDCRSFAANVLCIKPVSVAQYSYTSKSWCGGTPVTASITFPVAVLRCTTPSGPTAS
jgi:hypothetical protein